MSFIGSELIFFVTRLFSFYRYFDFFETELIILGSILNFFEKSFDSKMGEGGGGRGGGRYKYEAPEKMEPVIEYLWKFTL